MTGDLYPTKTRLALLRDVDAGNVVEDRDGHAYLVIDGDRRRIDARLRELVAASWVDQNDPWSPWEVADAGRAVLDSHPEPQP